MLDAGVSPRRDESNRLAGDHIGAAQAVDRLERPKDKPGES